MDDEDKLLYGDEAEVEEQGQEENVAENEVDLEANQNEDADNGLENGQNQVIFFPLHHSCAFFAILIYKTRNTTLKFRRKFKIRKSRLLVKRVKRAKRVKTTTTIQTMTTYKLPSITTKSKKQKPLIRTSV